MKTFLMATLVLAALVPAVVKAELTTLDVGFHTGYIPNGFDTNDTAQIVGEGLFSNGCYRPAGVDFSVDHVKKEITLNPKAYHYDGVCIQVLVPYSQVVDVGILKAGKYTVKQGDQKNLGELNVKLATNSSPDDYLYAPISQAYVTSSKGEVQVKISGEFTNSCMSLVQVLTEVQPRVIVVLPIAELVDGPLCAQGMFPFEKTITLKNVKPERYLLHVRSLNAKAINNLVTIE